MVSLLSCLGKEVSFQRSYLSIYLSISWNGSFLLYEIPGSDMTAAKEDLYCLLLDARAVKDGCLVKAGVAERGGAP